MAANIYLHLVVLAIISSYMYTEAITPSDQTAFSGALPFSVRLANGGNNSSGRVEVFHAGEWGTVCDDGWDSSDAVVVCRMLGYNDSKAQSFGSAHFGAGSGTIWMDDVACVGSEQSLDECPFNGWRKEYCSHSEDAGVGCLIDGTDSDIRLKGGPSLNVGRVEVYHSGIWGSVCDANSWGKSEADVTCRMLGYSAGQQIYRTTRYGSLTYPVWMTGVDCNGTEDSLADCTFDGWGQRGLCNGYPDAVFCYNNTETDFDIRLVGGIGPHVGRVEVYHSGVWGSVCDNSWDNDDAIVMCRMLGYRTGQSIRQTLDYGRLTDPVWMTGVDCNGTEDSLADCPFDGWGQVGYCSDYPANAFCYNATETNFDIRLSGGSGAHVGRVEVYYSGYWGTVCGDNNWDYKDANVTCRMLGYSTGQLLYPTTRYGSLSDPVWMSGVDCNGTEDSLADCSFDGWGRGGHCTNYPATVFCYNVTETDFHIRLTGGSGANVGRVEVYYSGYWGSVCGDNSWDNRDVNVTCRMLGYSSGQQTYDHYSKTDPVWMKGVKCIGTEDSLADCSFDGWMQGGYCSSYAAWVFCYNVTEQDIKIRLRGGIGPQIGRVEVYYSGYWGSVCGNDNHWDLRDANVTCRMLGYSAGQQIYRTSRYGSLTDPVWMTGVDCNGTEDSLADCHFDGWDKIGRCTSYPASVVCYNVTDNTPIRVRLVDGPYNYTGRIEVYYSGYWGTICSQIYSFDDKDAAVVCRMLHYSDGRAVSHISAVPNEPISMTNVRCNGTESSLADCPFDGWENVGYCYNQPYITCFNVAGNQTIAYM